jgi:hypothetical protein
MWFASGGSVGGTTEGILIVGSSGDVIMGKDLRFG